MECRMLRITLVSADNLPDVRSIGRMKVYAEVSINGESETSKCSEADAEGEMNPRWNVSMDDTINEWAVQQPGVNVVVKLLCKRTLGDRYIGQVDIPIKSLFDRGLSSQNILSYAVAGTPNGQLNINYSFGDKILAPKDSVWTKLLESGLATLLKEGAQIILDNV